MRWAFAILLVYGALLAVPMSSAKSPRLAIPDILESARLETRALQLFLSNPQDPDIEPLLDQSFARLREAAPHIPDAKLVADLNVAIRYDRRFLEGNDLDERSAALRFAITAKEYVIGQLSSRWVPSGSKPARVTGVTAARCVGCSKSDFWEINTHARRKRAKCSFRGPRGELSPARPLFPGTMQTTFCKLRRNGVVRAELTIRVPPGITARGSKPVTVTAHWQ